MGREKGEREREERQLDVKNLNAAETPAIYRAHMIGRSTHPFWRVGAHDSAVRGAPSDGRAGPLRKVMDPEEVWAGPLIGSEDSTYSGGTHKQAGRAWTVHGVSSRV